MTQAITVFFDAGLNLIYPPVCAFCGEQRVTARQGYVCSACWRKVRFIRPPFCERCGLPFAGEITATFECTNCKEMDLHFENARSAVVAEGLVLEALHRYKYQRAVWLEPFLADLFLREARQCLVPADWDAIIPVPLYPAKEREREFNQARRFAEHLAQTTGVSLNAKLLHRVIPTVTQTRLTRPQRAANMRGAFSLREQLPANCRRVVLVDDVFTTGATTSACAQVLKSAGVEQVCVWTVARGL